ncbi:hypothetical protein AB0G29_12935 [Streptomyces parvus]|uniref:hypothetical protein n=1 Tax=Streptomyces parvus TaxID=66428 RepID=UPI0033FCE42A
MSEINPPPSGLPVGFPEDRVPPNAPEVAFGYFECRSCGAVSDWVKANEKGNLPTTWDADHKRIWEHKKFYMWTNQRTTS